MGKTRDTSNWTGVILIAAENPKVVSERLGHSTIVLTMDAYTHVIPSMQKKASDKLTQMLYQREQKPLKERSGTLYAHKSKKGNQFDCPLSRVNH